jgi:hypothetical protein
MPRTKTPTEDVKIKCWNCGEIFTAALPVTGVYPRKVKCDSCKKANSVIF